MKIVGLSEKGARKLPNIICWTLFIILSSAYLFAANAEYRLRVVDIENNNTGEIRTVLHLQGDFDEGIADDANELLTKYQIDEAVLYSPGGLGYEGYKLGGYLSEHEVPVRVAKETYCISACAVAFLGGTDYKINDAVLAFHKGWIMGDMVFDSQNEAFDQGQIAGSYHAYYILANGFSIDLDQIIQMHSSPEKFIVFTHEDELNEYYVRSEKNNINDYLSEIDADYKVWGTEEITDHILENTNDNSWSLVSTIAEKSNIKS